MPAPAPTNEQAEKLALETIAHVERLAELATRFPESFKRLARQMPAWPVMRFRREARPDYFWHVLQKLELGEDYPIDISHNARSHLSSAMGQYLTRCIEQLHWFRLGREWQGSKPEVKRAELRALLNAALRMPPLSKLTSDAWSRQILVPLIMLCDAGRDEASCQETALKAIWQQAGVKSVATFKSRLLTKVRQTLHSLAKAP